MGTWRKAAFLILLSLQLAFVWAFPRFATQDGPSHLYNAAVIAALRSGTWSGLAGVFQLNQHLVPNWSTYFFLMMLMKVFSAATAEKVLVSGYFLLFAGSFWWVVKQLSPDGEAFLVWGLVLAGNWFLSMGFYNYCFGLVFFQLCFGYWLRGRKGFGIGKWVVLFALASVLYLTHLFVFLMALFLIGVSGLFVCVGDVRASRSPGLDLRSFAHVLLRQMVVPELCFFVLLLLNPFKAMGTQYVAHREAAPTLKDILHRITADHGTHLFHLLLDSYGPLARIFILLISVFVVAAFFCTLWRRDEPISAISYGIAAFSVVCAAVYFLGWGDYSGSGLLPERTGWFALWGVFVFLASRKWKARGKVFVTVMATLVCTTSLLAGALWRRQASGLLTAYDDAARVVQPGKTMLTMCYCAPWNTSDELFGRLSVIPLLHAGDITALDGRAIDVTNYEATGTSFPVEFFPQVNPAAQATDLMDWGSPERMDVDGYERKTGKSIDYILDWGEPMPLGEGSADSALRRQLRERYVLIYSSPGAAARSLHLFRKRGTEEDAGRDVAR